MNIRGIAISACLALVAAALAGCAATRRSQQPGLRRFEFTAVRMGVAARVVVFAEGEPRARAGAAAALDRVAALEDAMSDYRDQSELSRLCDLAGTGPVPISPDLFGALAAALEWSQRTDGAFDCTAGPLVALWRECRRTGRAPSPVALAEARARSGWRLIHLDARARTAALERPGMRLDLGGVGKGLAAEEASATLRRLGLPRHLVALAGDIVAGDPPPGQRGWRVEVDNGVRPPAVLELAGLAVSTSGGSAQFVEIDGVRRSHIIDPRTGLGVTGDLAATVVARRGAAADAMATSLAILGAAHAARLTGLVPGSRALLAEQGRVVWVSPGWTRLVASGGASEQDVHIR